MTMPAVATHHVRFRLRSGWATFESNGGARRADPLRGQLGRPGLWKLAGRGRRARVRRVFELPPSILPRPGSASSCFEELAGWAHATECGRHDHDWSPPPREEVERWLPAQALTLQVGSIALQGRMTHGDDRLAFDFPVVPRMPEDLPPAREAWLRELLADGQNRWRMVRIGLTDEGVGQAQVDLSGAPHDSLEQLVCVGLDALRHVVSSIVEPADFLVNGAESCCAVEFSPTQPKKRRTP
jgi:hypothetical protein